MNAYESMKRSPQTRKRAGVFLACETCKAEFYVMPSRLRQAEKQGVTVRYCSMKCYDKQGSNGPFFGKKHTKETIQRFTAHPNRPSFKADASNPNVLRFGTDYTPQGAKRLRQRLLDERGAKCERCGYREVVGVLEIHHKDRDPRNNVRANLALLCPTCHLVEHFLARDGGYTKLKPAA